MASRFHCAGEINHSGAGALSGGPILCGIRGGACKERELHSVEAVLIESANKRRLACGFSESTGHDAFIQEDNLGGGEVAVFKDGFQFLSAK